VSAYLLKNSFGRPVAEFMAAYVSLYALTLLLRDSGAQADFSNRAANPKLSSV
jgi:hypothetical protein